MSSPWPWLPGTEAAPSHSGGPSLRVDSRLNGPRAGCVCRDKIVLKVTDGLIVIPGRGLELLSVLLPRRALTGTSCLHLVLGRGREAMGLCTPWGRWLETHRGRTLGSDPVRLVCLPFSKQLTHPVQVLQLLPPRVPHAGPGEMGVTTPDPHGDSRWCQDDLSAWWPFAVWGEAAPKF